MLNIVLINAILSRLGNSLENEDLDDVRIDNRPFGSPVNLEFGKKGNLDYRKIIETIGKFLPDVTLSIEMLNFKDKSNIKNVENSIKLISKNFIN